VATGSRRNIAFDESTGQALVASTCTLVVEEWVESRRENHFEMLPAPLSILLLGTILLDSVNQNPQAGKVTDRDRAAIQSLLAWTDWYQLSYEARTALGMTVPRDRGDDDGGAAAPSAPDPSVLFELLQSSKFDTSFWASLSVRDALRLDYKLFRANGKASSSSPPSSPAGIALGMSTVLLRYRDFGNKPHFRDEVQKFMREHQLDLLAVMLATSGTQSDESTGGKGGSDSLIRQLVLCDVQGGNLVGGLVQRLLPDLRLLEILDGPAAADDPAASNLHIRAFDQGNVQASRKQVAPLLIDYFESC
jgi:inorganic pyrophosphatase/exopolyphosphatase